MLMSSAKPLRELENADEFVARHVGIAPEDEAHMLSGDELVDRKSTRLNSSHRSLSRMPSSA